MYLYNNNNKINYILAFIHRIKKLYYFYCNVVQNFKFSQWTLLATIPAIRHSVWSENENLNRTLKQKCKN